MTNQVRFNKYNVSNGTAKARVHYSLDNRIDGRKCVTIYAKDHKSGGALGLIVSDAYHNATDSQQDYFEKGRVGLFETHPLYSTARTAVEARG